MNTLSFTDNKEQSVEVPVALEVTEAPPQKDPNWVDYNEFLVNLA